MKKIYFIRHAKSSWKDENLSDFDRPLNKRGKNDAPFMGKRLHHFKVTPDLIISSPAKRAKNTANIIAETILYDKNKIYYETKLYESSFRTYNKIINNISDENEKVFIVAHNPDITQACEMYTDTIIGNIPTCGIICIEFDVKSFADIKDASGKLLFFDYPKKHTKE